MPFARSGREGNQGSPFEFFNLQRVLHVDNQLGDFETREEVQRSFEDGADGGITNWKNGGARSNAESGWGKNGLNRREV